MVPRVLWSTLKFAKKYYTLRVYTESRHEGTSEGTACDYAVEDPCISDSKYALDHTLIAFGFGISTLCSHCPLDVTCHLCHLPSPKFYTHRAPNDLFWGAPVSAVVHCTLNGSPRDDYDWLPKKHSTFWWPSGCH
jgi:hypothetical protein